MRRFAATVAVVLGLSAFGACGHEEQSVVTAPPGEGGGAGSTSSSTSSSSGGSGGFGTPDLPLPGEVTRTDVGQPPGDLHSVCEYGHAWRLHSHHGQNVSVVPQRQYVTSCEDGQGHHMFVSMPVDDGNGRTQYVYEALLDDATGEYTLTGNALHMGECEDASGLAAAADCSFLGVLCHRAHGSSEQEAVDADLITPYAGDSTSERGWVLRGDNAANDDTNTEMWLREYAGADLASTPTSFLVHKAVRATETARAAGQYYLKYADAQDSYAMAARSSMFTTGGDRHVADAFLIIRRGSSPAEWAIAGDRGYPWGCGRGHTQINHPGYNAVSDQFAIACRTDIGGGLYFRTDTMGDPDEFHNAPYCCNIPGGGPSTFAALPDGGFLLAMVSVEPEWVEAKTDELGIHPNDVWSMHVPTQIGLARFDENGAPVGDVQWVVSSNEFYLGHPQIASLGDGRYLLGWSEQWRMGEGVTEDLSIYTIRRRHSFQSAWAYYVAEIDADGNALTQARAIPGAGWGDFDEWTPLGDGRVGWSYIADPELIAWDEAPSCGESATPALFVYE